MSSKQITMICLDHLVSSKHQYRKFKDLFDFSLAKQELKTVESGANYKGFGVLHYEEKQYEREIF
jgi:hypothetical protein